MVLSAAVAQSTDPMVNSATEVRKTTLAPKRSDSQPASGMMAACARP